MAITIAAADVKRKLMIPSADTTYDSAISSLISETQSALEYGIDPAYLADVANSGLQALLTLGILEIICGEFLEQMCRETGASEEFVIAGMTLGERRQRGPELMKQGAQRLAPFMRHAAALSESLIKNSSDDRELALPSDCSW